MVLFCAVVGDRPRCSATSAPTSASSTLFRVLALYFLFTALGKAHEYRLRRRLEFRKLFWPQFLGGLAKGVISIALAWRARAPGA